MHAKAHRREAYPLTLERSIRILACSFSVLSDCEKFLTALDNRTQYAVQDFPVTRSHRLEVWRGDDGYTLREDGRSLDPQPDAEAAAEALFYRLYELSFEALPQFTKIHAGCASWQGKRFLIAGPARAGKTTLVTRMLFEGFAVHCDDVVLLRQGEVLPYPRRLWIRSDSLRLLPQIAPFIARSPETREHFSLDPTELGFEWQINAAPVEAVFFLEPNHGANTRIEACPKYSMAKLIMSQSTLPASGATQWVRDVCAMLDIAACYLLHCGSLSSAIEGVKSVL